MTTFQQELFARAFLEDAPGRETDKEFVARWKLEQPAVLGGRAVMKDPQLLAYYYSQYSPRFILGFDKGMGKTLTYLAIALSREAPRILILCGKNAFLAQVSQLEQYFPGVAYSIIEGTPAARAKGWAAEARVYITTPATLLADMGKRTQASRERRAPVWVSDPRTFIIHDEFHRAIRTHKSGTFRLLKELNPQNAIFSSGSSIGKGPQDLFAALHLCSPSLFRGYWPYINRFCDVEEGVWGREIAGPIRVPEWRKLVAPYYLRRVKDLQDYPAKTRQLLRVTMPKWQKQVHDSLLRELVAELPDGTLLAAANTAAAFIKLQQFMICPRTLSTAFDWGAGLEGIWQDVQESELKHFVISTPFRAPIPHIQQFFQDKGVPNYALMGGMKGPMSLKDTIARWTLTGGCIVQTIDYAESYELPAARVMYMLGYRHSPAKNMQAEDRIHRDIRVTPHPVDIYYVKHEDAYDTIILEALATHADNVAALQDMPLTSLLKTVP